MKEDRKELPLINPIPNLSMESNGFMSANHNSILCRLCASSNVHCTLLPLPPVGRGRLIPNCSDFDEAKKDTCFNMIQMEKYSEKFYSTATKYERPKDLVVRLGIYPSNVDDEITDSAGVTPFVVVPGDQLDKVGIQLNSSPSVEDGGICASNPIG